MDQTFLYTLPQWIVFAAIFVTVYGWVEDKKSFRLIGTSIFILLGIFSFVLFSGDYFAAAEFLTPEEAMREEIDDEIINEIPFQARLMPAYWTFILSGLLAVPALFLDWKNKKAYRIFIVLSSLLALLGFFIIVGNIRSL